MRVHTVMISRVVSRFWNSPTFTTWGQQLVESLRLIAVTPLILTRFETTEIAAWFLFGSLMIFGSLLTSRTALTTLRMIALAAGGAENLGPTREQKLRSFHERGANWALIERVYGSSGVYFIGLAFVSALLALLLGYYSLNNLTHDYAGKSDIWAAFLIVLAGRTFQTSFYRYEVYLKGLNYIPLINRWNIVFAFSSIMGGCIVLLLNGNIVLLATTMQGIICLGVLRSYLLARYVEEGRLIKFAPLCFDRETLNWAWEPFWRGFVLNIANSGLIHFASIIYVANAPPEASAAFLFTLKIITSVKSFADSPFTSHSPKMSKLLAQGRTNELRFIVVRKYSQSQWLFIGICLFVLIAGDPILEMISANTRFIDLRAFAVAILYLSMQNNNVLLLKIPAIGNNFICMLRQISAAIVSLMLLAVAKDFITEEMILSIIFLPNILILNIKPACFAAEMISVKTNRLLYHFVLPPIVAVIILLLLVVALNS